MKNSPLSQANISCSTFWIELRKVVTMLMIFRWCKQCDPLHQLTGNLLKKLHLITQALTCQCGQMYSISLPFLSPRTLGTYSVQRGSWKDRTKISVWSPLPDFGFGHHGTVSKNLSHQILSPVFQVLHLTQTAVPRSQCYNALVSHAYVQLLFQVMQILYQSFWALGNFSFSHTLGHNQFSFMTLRPCVQPGPQPILALASTWILFWGLLVCFLGQQTLVRTLKIHHDESL